MLVINFSALGNNKMEKPHIELEVVTTVESTEDVFFKVKNNKLNNEFNNGKDFFKASNKIRISSVAYPEWDGICMLLCVRGKLHQLDEIILKANSKEFEKIKQAVEEYNNSFCLPEFVFRVSTNKLDTSIEATLTKLEQDNKWKEMVSKDFKSFADEVVPAGSEYEIKYIQVNDKMLFTEVEYNNPIKHNKGMIHISAYIGDDDWTIYYNGCTKYKL